LTNELFSDTTQFLRDATGVNAGIWYQVVLTWNRETNATQLWVNGELRAEGPTATVPLAKVMLTFGRSKVHGDPFWGILDEVRIYDHILTPARIRALAVGLF
jgi:hypothetical protein